MIPHWTTTMVYWLAAVSPALPFVLIYLAYRRTLLGKRLTVEQVMSRECVLESYLNAFGNAASSDKNPDAKTPDAKTAGAKAADAKTADAKTVVNALFNLYYHWRSYANALLLNVLITIAAIACILVSKEVPLGLAPALNELARKTLPTVAFGFAGAYIWNLYDLIRRYRAVDLTPAAFQFCWLRLLAACIVSPLAALAVTEGVKNIVAFGFGILPLQTIFQYFTDYATKLLKLAAAQTKAEAPTLQNLQGMTVDSIERMAEERIDSVATLSYSDPMKLFLKTDIEWVVIIDVIDQALLFNYIGEKITVARPAGVRGSIELATIYDRIVSGQQAEIDAAKALIALLAPKLELSIPETVNLARTVWEDAQVILIWDLFGESFPGEAEAKRRSRAATATAKV